MWLTHKCYLVQSQNKLGKINITVKVFRRSIINYFYFECYKGVLDVFHKTAVVSKLEGKIFTMPRM